MLLTLGLNAMELLKVILCKVHPFHLLSVAACGLAAKNSDHALG
jgi:hypothetical protein